MGVWLWITWCCIHLESISFFHYACMLLQVNDQSSSRAPHARFLHSLPNNPCVMVTVDKLYSQHFSENNPAKKKKRKKGKFGLHWRVGQLLKQEDFSHVVFCVCSLMEIQYLRVLSLFLSPHGDISCSEWSSVLFYYRSNGATKIRDICQII